MEHHTPECPHREDPPMASEIVGFVDFFCDSCHGRDIRVFANGNISWPTGWKAEQADQWRLEHRLTKPTTWLDGVDGRSYHLVTVDTQMMAMAASARKQPQTFVYSDGSKQQAVAGMVTGICREGPSSRFTVIPSEEGAHAI